MKIQENTNHKAAESNSEDITMRKQRRLDLFESELGTLTHTQSILTIAIWATLITVCIINVCVDKQVSHVVVLLMLVNMLRMDYQLTHREVIIVTKMPDDSYVRDE